MTKTFLMVKRHWLIMLFYRPKIVKILKSLKFRLFIVIVKKMRASASEGSQSLDFENPSFTWLFLPQ